ncbi:MAG: class I SAM-dependent methyltransferase [Desulfuromonadales bacterium]
MSLSHLFAGTFLHEGDKAIDATCGNGYDTLALAKLTGSSGHVYGFDIQEQAIRETSRRLAEAGLAGRVTLLQIGHEKMEQLVRSPVKAVLFNLGYLPGSDHMIMTRPDTTRIAMNHSLKLLEPGGIVLITVYPGHDGGTDEQHAVDDWAAGLDPRKYHSWRMGQMNVISDAPYCVLVQKAA